MSACTSSFTEPGLVKPTPGRNRREHYRGTPRSRRPARAKPCTSARPLISVRLRDRVALADVDQCDVDLSELRVNGDHQSSGEQRAGDSLTSQKWPPQT